VSRVDKDAGSGTVLVLALSAVLALAGTVFVAVAAVAVARHRAASAADRAALAAADRALAGPVPACAAALRAAAGVEAVLLRCRLDGDVADVVVALRPPGPLGGLGRATSRARAGPADARAG
jgi:secretion/DNA translocation related TadE-like protein